MKQVSLALTVLLLTLTMTGALAGQGREMARRKSHLPKFHSSGWARGSDRADAIRNAVVNHTYAAKLHQACEKSGGEFRVIIQRRRCQRTGGRNSRSVKGTRCIVWFDTKCE